MGSGHRRGRDGEDRAAHFLEQKGCRILSRNFRNRAGEVDIICEAGALLLFVEVKTWRSYPEDQLGPAIGVLKQRRIVDVARYFLWLHPELRERGVRFDVVMVNPESDRIRHIEGAFEAPCPE
jgi:putative endonuclease